MADLKNDPVTANPLSGRVGGIGTGAVQPAPADVHTNPADYPQPNTVEVEDIANPFPWAPEEEIVPPGPGATRAASELVQNYNPYPALSATRDEDDIIVHISEVDRETTMYPGPAVERVRRQYARRLEATEEINKKITDAIRSSISTSASSSAPKRTNSPSPRDTTDAPKYPQSNREAIDAKDKHDREMKARADKAAKEAEEAASKAPPVGSGRSK